MRTYKWKKDAVDLRDIHFRSVYKDHTELPKTVDLRDICPPVYDQGQLGSCTANALVGLREYLLQKSGVGITPLSRLYVYWHERNLEGTVQEDSGAYLRDGMRVLTSNGAAPEVDFPYDIRTFTHTPSAQAEKDAKAFTLTSYTRIADVTAMKAALAQGSPVAFGIPVYESFEGEKAATTGKIPLPKAREQLLGGHALLAVGYKTIGRTKYIIVRNSWGEGWGDNGYCYLPESYFTRYKNQIDMWAAQ